MKFLLALLTGAMLFVSNNISNEKRTITATVVNAISDDGNVSFALYNKESFMKKPLQAKTAKITEGKSSVTFTDVEPGEYAILCFHDKNENNKMDFSESGMPLEDYGSSNNVMTMGPPVYETSKFVVSDKNVTLKIKF